MIEWLELPEQRRREIIIAAAAQNGMLEQAVEKDWWVTLTLKAVFSTQWAGDLVFKGGTSLSKAWGLIERFSEDIDLALDRKVLGFPEEFVNNSQVSKLRKKASKFIAEDFKTALEKTLINIGLPATAFSLEIQPTDLSDRDPQVLELTYTSIITKGTYIKDKVVIEIGVRSEREPASPRPIQSIIGMTFPDQPYSGNSFEVKTIEPKRTFLEKAFLLHEGFLSPHPLHRHERKSRHIYDLISIMETDHAEAALHESALYSSIVEHRKHFTPERGITYDLHLPQTINFIPPDNVLKEWESDYRNMRESMIYGNAPDFFKLILKLKELLVRFRLVGSLYQLQHLKQIAINDTSNIPTNLKDGIAITVPVHLQTDLYLPAGPANKSISYYLTLTFYQNDWYCSNIEIKE